MSCLVKCRNLTKDFGKKRALNHIDLELESGHLIGLLGPNGSGKTTLIKILNGLLNPTEGTVRFCDKPIGVESKMHISYLPDQTYLNSNQRVCDLLDFFRTFCDDFDMERAYHMLEILQIQPTDRLKSLSKGTKEKVQLILVMSRRAMLYILDEPIAGVDPAARDYILNTIITNYEPESSVLISTHLISDIENILDEVIFLKDGEILLHSAVEDIRIKEGKSVDTLFREVFKCL